MQEVFSFYSVYFQCSRKYSAILTYDAESKVKSAERAFVYVWRKDPPKFRSHYDTRFSSSVFFVNQYLIGAIENFTKIRGDIMNFVFIFGVVDTGDKPFAGVNDTDDKLWPVSLTPEIKPCHGFFIDSMTPAINFFAVTTTSAMKQLQQYQLAYISKGTFKKIIM